MTRTFTVELTEREVATLEHLAAWTGQTADGALRHLHRSALFAFVTAYLSKDITTCNGFGWGPIDPKVQQQELDRFTNALMAGPAGDLPN